MLTKKHWILIGFLIAAIVIYYCFFRKKTTDKKVGDTGSIVPSQPIVSAPSTEQSYVGPQDCAENCDIPYDRQIVACYEKFDGSTQCLDHVEAMRQECLGKCDKSLPPNIDLSEIIETPLQEDNFSNFSNLFKQGYV